MSCGGSWWSGRSRRSPTPAGCCCMWSGGWPPRASTRGGAREQRSKKTRQGSAVSPILANLFMHYAFDPWMARNFPGCPFERCADDAVVHCKSRRQAGARALKDRRADGGGGARALPGQDADRLPPGWSAPGGAGAHLVQLARVCLPGAGGARKNGRNLAGLLPAISREALKAKGAELRRVWIDRRSDLSLDDRARWPNPSSPGGPTTTAGSTGRARSPPQARQRLPEALGRQEVQAAADRQALPRLVDRAAPKPSPALFIHWGTLRTP